MASILRKLSIRRKTLPKINSAPTIFPASETTTPTATTNNRGRGSLTEILKTVEKVQQQQQQRKSESFAIAQKRRTVTNKVATNETEEVVEKQHGTIETSNVFKTNFNEITSSVNPGTYKVVIENIGAAEAVKEVHAFVDSNEVQSLTQEIPAGEKWESDMFKITQQDSRVYFQICGDIGLEYTLSLVRLEESIYVESFCVTHEITHKRIPLSDNGIYRVKVIAPNTTAPLYGNTTYSGWCEVSLEPSQEFVYSCDSINSCSSWESPDIVFLKMNQETEPVIDIKVGARVPFLKSTRINYEVEDKQLFTITVYRLADKSLVAPSEEEDQLCDELIKRMDYEYSRRDISRLEQILNRIPSEGEEAKKFGKALSHGSTLKYELHQFLNIHTAIVKAVIDREDRHLDKTYKQAEGLEFHQLLKKIEIAKEVISNVLQARAEASRILANHLQQFMNIAKLSLEAELDMLAEREAIINKLREVQLSTQNKLRIIAGSLEAPAHASAASTYFCLFQVWGEIHSILQKKLNASETKRVLEYVEHLTKRLGYLTECSYETLRDTTAPVIQQSLNSLKGRVDPESIRLANWLEEDLSFLDFVVLYRQGAADFPESLKKEKLPALQNLIHSLVQKKLAASGREETHKRVISDMVVKMDIFNLKIYLAENENSIEKSELQRCMKIISLIESSSSDFVALLNSQEKQRMGFDVSETISQPEGKEEQKTEVISETSVTEPSAAANQVASSLRKRLSGDNSRTSFFFAPISATVKPIYRQDLNNINIVTNMKKVAVNLISYFKTKKAANKTAKLEVLGNEMNDKMEIGHYLRKQWIPVLTAVFTIGLKQEADLWQFVEDIAKACPHSDREDSLPNFVQLLNASVHLDDLKMSKDMAHLALTKFRMLLCICTNQRMLKHVLQTIIETSHANNNQLLDKYYPDPDQCTFSSPSSTKQIIEALEDPSKLPQHWDTSIVQNEYNVEEHYSE